MFVREQDIPPEYYDIYRVAFQLPTLWKGINYVRKRYPWRLPQMQTLGTGVTAAQKAHRKVYKQCVACYNNQPYSGGVTPPTTGFRNRSWWYNAAIGSGLWYFCYFMRQTINAFLAGGPVDWCSQLTAKDTNVRSHMTNSKFGTNTTMITIKDVDKEIWIIVSKESANHTRLHLKISNAGYIAKYNYKLLVALYQTTNDWIENLVTWNLKPPTGDVIGSRWINEPNGTWITFVIPSWVDSFYIKQIWPTAETDELVHMVFHTKEAVVAANRPYTD